MTNYFSRGGRDAYAEHMLNMATINTVAYSG